MPDCKLCGTETKACLSNRPDYEYEIPDRLTYFRCVSCKLVFASPCPTPDEVSRFYKHYSTHQTARPSLLNKLERMMMLRETVKAIGKKRDIRILDYGCGNGGFLRALSAEGYHDVIGYDFDSNAVAAARLTGISATDDLASLVGIYDVITLNHVIEHFVDPVEELKKLTIKLAENGRIVIRTPNNRSFMARLTGDHWRGWETPRHLNIMNKVALQAMLLQAGLEPSRCYNSKAMYFGVFHESFRGAKWATLPGKVLRHIAAFLFWPIPGGEEAVAIAHRSR